MSTPPHSAVADPRATATDTTETTPETGITAHLLQQAEQLAAAVREHLGERQA
ncbi:hypothetical protein [Streptomyces litchfieldiae]|uniref:Uncharacterized protein n=1 Tax=Streptomyces litchfieldiae TaxID=3075543 RepID=A0ABU2MN63_9ACTN|nr:hypothetical protein [Streptomyces sp. DSM 44938]MDT0343055.1 hypothetical protein [Streptomyces sp. DSM 44938]